MSGTPPSTDLAANIVSNATGPASASNDSGSVTQHNLRDQIEADRYLNSKANLAKANRGVLFSKLVPPGAG